MSPRRSTLVIILPIVFAAACGEGAKESSPGEVLARDSALAEDLRVASDTSAFSEAADVAMADEPDTLPRTATARVPTPAAAAPAAPPSSPTTTRPAMRVPATPATANPAHPTAQPRPAAVEIPAAALPKVTKREAASAMPPAARLPDLRRPAPIAPTVAARPASPTSTNEVCASPAREDQRRCLMMHLAKSDAALDHTYQAVITALKRQAGATAGTKEPESVHRLRVAQRAWLVYRDDECRRRNRGKEGPLWAPLRAECLGQFSEYRSEELAQTLTRLSP